ncbi:recombinase family protein [Rhodococcus hoagii]|nr:recombinase family protein [Prescottella equi]MBM4645564.1 recombinase family protein [Prescottella equi]MBM4657414.1 recombinase family protein [Prescottella equi]MBM4720208.1 recombinase family protein [Prescottella equi]MBM4720274.1 recombinase family protein [Prescottella equi]
MRAIIYARVSADQSGRGRSVSEQEAECRAICQREGWDVAEVLSDNDVGASRFSRVKDRPAYERLKQVLQAGDVLVLWEASRASRKLDGYVELRDLCAERGVLWNIGGQTYDPSRSNDRVMTGIRAIISEDEAHQIQQRVLRAHRANAERGLAHGKIPYGYRAVRDADTGKIVERVPDEGEAPIVREMVRRFLAGESVWAIAKDLNERGVSTPGSSPLWRASIMTQMLKRPTYAGLRTHRGVVTGRGEWEALISEDDHRAVVAALSDPSRRTHRGVEPKHLLTGIATCGECASVVWRLKSNGRSVYACPKGCVSRRMDYVDELVVDAIIAWAESYDVTTDVADDPAAAAAAEEARALRSRLSELEGEAVLGRISAAAFGRFEAALLRKIDDADARARPKTRPAVVADFVGDGAAGRWDRLSVTDRRVVVRSLVRVKIKTTASGRMFNPESVVMEWV